MWLSNGSLDGHLFHIKENSVKESMKSSFFSEYVFINGLTLNRNKFTYNQKIDIVLDHSRYDFGKNDFFFKINKTVESLQS